jgi:hypothetical protein
VINMETEKMLNSLEQDLFSWAGWDEADIMSIQFYDVVLKVDIGKYKKGTKFEWACIDFQTSTLELGESADKSEKFGLHLNIEDLKKEFKEAVKSGDCDGNTQKTSSSRASRLTTPPHKSLKQY